MKCAICGKPASWENDLGARVESGGKRVTRIEHSDCAKRLEPETTSMRARLDFERTLHYVDTIYQSNR